MIVLNAPQEALEIPLMPAGGFMLAALELGVLDICTAVLAPISGLLYKLARQRALRNPGMPSHTVDFQ